MSLTSKLSRPSAIAARCLALPAISLLVLGLSTGCHSTPANPLIGTWTLTADGTGPKVCAGAQQKVTFTDNSSQIWDGQGRTGGPVMISYVVQLPNVFIPGVGGNVTYTVSGANIIWYSPYGPCTYSKA
jgi:hypothetical protein